MSKVREGGLTPAEIAREKLIPMITAVSDRLGNMQGGAQLVHQLNNIRCGVVALMRYAEAIEAACLGCPRRLRDGLVKDRGYG